MRDVVLIGCAKSKRDAPSPARKLYDESPLFRKRLRYAEHLDSHRILILSAKHHVLTLDEEVAPYDETLRNKSASEVRAWAEETAEQLREHADLDRDRFTILAGSDYYEELLPRLSSYRLPTGGLRPGERQRYLDQTVGVTDE